MPEEPQRDRVSDLLNRLGLTGRHLQNVRLGPGVVGRNSTVAWVCSIVMLAGVVASAYLKSVPLLGVSLVGAVVVWLGTVVANLYFGNKNPAAALMEGAQFLQYHQMEMAARGMPTIEPSLPIPPPTLLPPGESPKTSEDNKK